MPPLVFFIGKGGVGKTTLSAAYAVRAALRSPRRVLLISTDPAHSLADVFGTPLPGRPHPVPLGGRRRLFVWQVDAEKQFRRFLGRYRAQILDLVESGTMFTRKEIEPLLDTTLPGMAEVAALIALHELLAAEEYDQIVVDTAPMGHTLRLFELPESLARLLAFLDAAAGRDRVLAERFGGRVVSPPLLAEWSAMVESVRGVLTQENSRLVLVVTPEKFALSESQRAAQELAESVPGLRISQVALNRAVRDGGECRFCKARERATRSATAFIKRVFPRAEVLMGEDSGEPVVGAEALAAFGEHVFGGRALRLPTTKAETPGNMPRLVPAAWPSLATPLTLTIGKGGVGKTTISAALAVRHRWTHPRQRVTVCSTDPAPSLDDVFQQEVGGRPGPVLGDRGLLAMEFDSVAEFRAWSGRVKQEVEQALTPEGRGLHLDLSLDREVITALLDIVPPGVDELFAIFRILELVEEGRGTVVIDMAPTGHALELLRMPGRVLLWSRLLLKSLAAHRTLPLARDVGVEIARVSQQARALVAALEDPERAQVAAVTLAEPLPDRETARLLRDLHALGVHAGRIFVNRVIAAGDAGGCRRCRRKHAWQMRTLASFRRRRGEEVFAVRNFPAEIAGARALQRFTRGLWRLE